MRTFRGSRGCLPRSRSGPAHDASLLQASSAGAVLVPSRSSQPASTAYCGGRGFALLHKVESAAHSPVPGLAPVLPYISADARLRSSLVFLRPQHGAGEPVALQPGDHMLHERTFSMEDGRTFAALSGDHNAIHQPFPSSGPPPSCPFSRPVVPGLLTSSLFSTVFGCTLPGSVYLSQTLRFRRPVEYEQPLVVRVQINEVRRHKGKGKTAETQSAVGRAIVECSTVISAAQDGQVVLDGHASVLVPAVRFPAREEEEYKI